MKIIYLFKESYKELKKTDSIVFAGILLAMAILLDRFSIPIGKITQIGFGFIITGVSATLFGPIYSGILGGVGDILKHFIAPKGEYFFGWTLNPILAGIIYGIFFYKKGFDINNKKQFLIRIICAKFIVALLINVVLGSLWVYITSGKAFLPLLSVRVTKELVVFPIQVIILFYVLPIVNKLKNKLD